MGDAAGVGLARIGDRLEGVLGGRPLSQVARRLQIPLIEVYGDENASEKFPSDI